MARNILVTGSRTWRTHAAIKLALGKLAERDPNAIVHHGDAAGADRICAKVASNLGLTVVAHPADWDTHGKAAGFVRNLEMLDYEPTAVYGFWADKSRGTYHCLVKAYERGIPVVIWDDPSSLKFRKFIKS